MVGAPSSDALTAGLVRIRADDAQPASAWASGLRTGHFSRHGAPIGGGSDVSAVFGADAITNDGPVGVPDRAADGASDSEPVHRTEPGALTRTVTRARVRTHGESDAGAK